MPLRTLNRRLSTLCAAGLLALLTPSLSHAGHGFFSPAPGSAGPFTQLEVTPDGTVWALSGGALHTVADEGRSWRLRSREAGLHFLWVDPSDSSVIATWTNFFGLSALLVSEDGGQTFVRRPMPEPRLREFTPTTGPWFILFQGDFGARPYRSDDRGASWQQLSDITSFDIDAGPAGDPFVLARGGSLYSLSSSGDALELRAQFSGEDVRDLYVSPTDPRRVLAFTDEGAVLRSTDRGLSYSRSVLPGVDRVFGGEAIFHPTDASLVIAAVNPSGEEGFKLYRSTDGGVSWALTADIDGLSSVPRLTFDACDSSVVYATNTLTEGFRRSRDRGATWQEISPQAPTAGSFVFDGLTATSEGCRLVASTSQGVVSSTDQGETWQATRRGLRSGFVRELAFDPETPDRVFGASRGGLIRSDDGGRTFAPMVNELTGLDIFRLLIHPDGTLLATTREFFEIEGRVWLSADGGVTFTESTGASIRDGELLAADPSNPSRLISSGPGGIFESLDFGRTWQLLREAGGPTATLVIDPRDPAKLWGSSTFSFFRSEDGGRTWTGSSEDFVGQFVKVHPATGELWAAGIVNGIYRSADEGQTWTLAALLPSFNEPQDLIFDRRDPATLYYTSWTFAGEPAIYRTRDDGATWTEWSEGFAPELANTLLQDPADAERWLLAGPGGVHWRVERPLPSCPTYREPGLCLRGERFEVAVDWLDFAGRSGQAELVPFQTGESGLFTFFSPENWEIMVKVLDGCGFNQHFWVFSAGTTNVDFSVRVTDRRTGNYREYFNFLGENAPAVTDIEAFACDESVLAPSALVPSVPGPLTSLQTVPLQTVPLQTVPLQTVPAPSTLASSKPSPRDSSNSPLLPTSSMASLTPLATPPKAACEDNPEALCLGEDGRFRVIVRWRDFAGLEGSGLPVSFATGESGLFTFFAPTNWEMMVKVLDGCGFNDRFWIFAAAVTNVEFELQVTDQLTGEVRIYSNPLGRSADAIIDTSAFGGCPAP